MLRVNFCVKSCFKNLFNHSCFLQISFLILYFINNIRTCSLNCISCFNDSRITRLSILGANVQFSELFREIKSPELVSYSFFSAEGKLGITPVTRIVMTTSKAEFKGRFRVLFLFAIGRYLWLSSLLIYLKRQLMWNNRSDPIFILFL